MPGHHPFPGAPAAHAGSGPALVLGQKVKAWEAAERRPSLRTSVTASPSRVPRGPGEIPVKASHRCALGEDGVQAKRGFVIQLSLGDEAAAAAGKSDRARGWALSTQRKGQQHLERKKQVSGLFLP